MTAWVTDEIARLRALGYDELARRAWTDFHDDRITPSGADVNVSTFYDWDDPDRHTLRVSVSADQPRSGRLPPPVASDDFIIAPDGSFIGE